MLQTFEVHEKKGKGGGSCFRDQWFSGSNLSKGPLAWELAQAGLAYAREIEQEIFYKEFQEPIGTRRADFVVEGKVLVELKAIIELEDVHLAQVLNYLKAYKLEVGLLINFGSKSLTFKRIVL